MSGEPIITIVGNLTSDPELRYVASGTPVASFTVASTPRNLNKQTNQWEDGEAMFVRCSVWREYGENVAESLTKGMRVVVTGRLTVRSYEYNGQQRTSIEMQVDEVGPSLRYARAQVVKVPHGQNPSQASQNGFSAPQTQNTGAWASGGPVGPQNGTQGFGNDPAGNLGNVEQQFNQQDQLGGFNAPPF